jgi:plasmid stabilization system protein ParE
VAEVIYTAEAFADVERLERAAPGAASLIAGAVSVLAANPCIGRPVERDLRELVISRGRTGHLALYAFDEVRDLTIVLAVRHQREAGYEGD